VTRSEKVVKAKTGILLDVSLGGTAQPNSVTFADLKASPLKVPWPLKDGECHTAVVTHCLEFVEPTHIFRWFDELHRVMRPGGIVYLSGPYGGELGDGWLSDPSHRTRITERSFIWLDPRGPYWQNHADIGRQHPRPWQVLQATRAPGMNGTQTYNVVMKSLAVNGHGRNGTKP
jgi:hypothetical protein